jgi:BirA family biotin operon repressor/biotin-[acetyl-CoA-carboxylase] ligase
VVEGQWLVADRQNAGRGRLGRVWNDGLGNFMGSTVVRIDPHQPPAPSLALAAACRSGLCR